MACDSVEVGPQEPPPRLAAAVRAPDQQLRPRRPLFLDARGRDERAPRRRIRRRGAFESLLGAAATRRAPAHLAGAVALLGAAATRRAPANLGGAVSMLRRRALADEEEQVDAVANAVHHNHGVAEHALAPAAEGLSEETTSTALLLPSEVAGSFSKEYLGPEERARLELTQEPPHCAAAQTHSARVQAMSSLLNSTEDLMSCLQDSKAVRLLAGKTREKYDVGYMDSVEECVSIALQMLLLVFEEKISAPASLVLEDISTRIAWLLLKNMSRIPVGCLPFSVDSECVTDFLSAEFGLLEKVVLIGLKRGSQIQIRSFSSVEFEVEEGVENARYRMVSKRMDVKDAVARPCLPAELQINTSLSQSTHQWAETNQKMSDVDSVDNGCLVIPIFVGKLTMTVSLNQSSQHLMHQYAQRTKTSLEYQYFVYGGKKLEPNHSLLFYGLERNTTVHVCTRLLGGKPPTTLGDYVRDNSHTFTVEVTLPHGEVSLQMTTKGCQFLSSWINCFTTAFARGESWNGDFTLESFKYVDGHIRNIKWPKEKCPPGSMGSDLTVFVGHVEDILCSNSPYLISKYPPYLKQFLSFVNRLSLTVSNVLSSEDKLFLETHVCCMTCYARERLIIELFRKYEGREDSDWETAIKNASCSETWVSDLPTKSQFFSYVITKAKSKGVEYKQSRPSAFVFIKDIVLHTTDFYDDNVYAQQFGDGIELMIPAHLEDFLPTIIQNLIEKKVDISAELLAAIKCACRICDSSH